MQIDPVKPTLKAPGTLRLKHKHVKLLSNFAFEFNLRRYSVVYNGTKSPMYPHTTAYDVDAAISGRGLHSFTFQLILSTLYEIGGCA